MSTISPITRTFVMFGAVFGLIGVALGAFGTHGLRAYFDANPSLEATFETGIQYHLIHALALIGTAWAANTFTGNRSRRWTRAAGWLFVMGIILFSGSLYVLSMANVRFMGAVAPLGGVSFITGWACLAIAAYVDNRP